MLTRKQLLNGKSFLPFEVVNVPELGGKLGVQGMTAGDAVEYYKLVEKRKNDGMDVEALAKLIVRCVVDDKHERVFEDDDWMAVMAWPHAALQKVALVAMRLNSWSAGGN